MDLSPANPLSSRGPGRPVDASRSARWRPAIALLPLAAAFGLHYLLWPYIEPNVWFLFFPALFLSSWLASVAQGIGMTVVCALAIWFVLVPAERADASPEMLFPVLVFAASGILFSLFHDRVKRANAALAKALGERRIFAALVDNSSDFIGIADPAGTPIYVNPAGRRMVGIAPERPINTTTIRDFYAADQREFAQNVILQTMLETGLWHGETRFRHFETDAPIPVDDTHFLIRDLDTGEVLGLATVTRDISEIKRLETSLRETSADLARAQEVAEVGSWRFDRTKGELRWSDETYRIFDMPVGKLVDYTAFLDHVHPDDRALVDAKWQAALRGAPYDLEHRIVAGSGEVRWVREKAELAFDAHGAPLGGIGIVQNVTERRRLEDEQRLLSDVGVLVASTLDYEQVLMNLTQLVVRDLADYCIVDMLDETGKLHRHSVACRDPANRWIADVLAKVAIDPDRPYLTGAVLTTRRPALVANVTHEQLEGFAHDAQHLAALEAMQPQSVVLAPLIARDTLLGAIGLVAGHASRPWGESDIRLVEELARRAAISIDNARLYRAAQRAIKSRDDVLGIVAHDLRNPLNAITLHAALIHKRGDEHLQRRSEAIERATRRMDRLIQDMLDVTRLESGHMTVEQARVATRLVLADALDAQRPHAQAAKVDLRLEVAGNLPDVWADRDRILQILENLIGNACKFTPAGGQIVVRAAPRDHEVVFSVADTGRGIAPEHQPHVFDRFWQTREARRGGAGLGLPIVKGIVEAHGGALWFESAVGRGTTFHFTIPTYPPQEQLRDSRRTATG